MDRPYTGNQRLLVAIHAEVGTGAGRIIQLAWMRGGTYPDMPFNQQITFPCELTLHATPSGLRLFRAPVREIALLHKHAHTWSTRSLGAGAHWDLPQTGDLFHIQMAVSIPAGATLTFHIRGVPLTMTHDTLACGTDPQPLSGDLKTIEVLIDRTSIEAFANHGEVSLSRCMLPNETGLSLQVAGGPVTIHSLTVYQLNSMWNADAQPKEGPR